MNLTIFHSYFVPEISEELLKTWRFEILKISNTSEILSIWKNSKILKDFKDYWNRKDFMNQLSTTVPIDVVKIIDESPSEITWLLTILIKSKCNGILRTIRDLYFLRKIVEVVPNKKNGRKWFKNCKITQISYFKDFKHFQMMQKFPIILEISRNFFAISKINFLRFLEIETIYKISEFLRFQRFFKGFPAKFIPNFKIFPKFPHQSFGYSF